MNNLGVVTSELAGGLGNQLFQVATALACAWDNCMDCTFVHVGESPSVFGPRPVYWNTVFHALPVSDETIVANMRTIAERHFGIYQHLDVSRGDRVWTSADFGPEYARLPGKAATPCIDDRITTAPATFCRASSSAHPRARRIGPV